MGPDTAVVLWVGAALPGPGTSWPKTTHSSQDALGPLSYHPPSQLGPWEGQSPQSPMFCIRTPLWPRTKSPDYCPDCTQTQQTPAKHLLHTWLSMVLLRLLPAPGLSRPSGSEASGNHHPLPDTTGSCPSASVLLLETSALGEGSPGF
jgi:hypothetical protein